MSYSPHARAIACATADVNGTQEKCSANAGCQDTFPVDLLTDLEMPCCVFNP